MTEIGIPIADAEFQPRLAPGPAAVPVEYPTGVAAQYDGTIEEEDQSVIKCVCGYSDDDGSTVLCEKCNTWQHIDCYYFPTLAVPEVHYCIDCEPRQLDRHAAHERQRFRREGEQLSALLDRRQRKPPAKSHKKKVKDSPVPVQINGWPLPDKGDHRNGSPREQPPTKRPKTSHRTSDSTSKHPSASALAAATRKRTGSVAQAGRSPTKSPPTPNGVNGMIEYFSPEFLELYRDAASYQVQANNTHSLAVTTQMSDWLADEDALTKATHGLKKQDVFSRITKTLEHIPTPRVEKRVETDTSVTIHGSHPTWYLLVLPDGVVNDGHIGELNGEIMLRADYEQTKGSPWNILEHPEPFVFLHPLLPLVIDARSRGSIYRYVRRSCRPNARIKTIIVNNRDYHFCLTATDDIPPGTEVTIGWEIADDIRAMLTSVIGNGNKQDKVRYADEPDFVSSWATSLLAHFGGCACGLPQHACLMGRFDRRGQTRTSPTATGSAKPKAKRVRKTGAQNSPLSTGHATNSRAGSEAVIRPQPDDDNVDSRSTSGPRSKPNSRDITPMTHVSEAHAAAHGLSKREERKLAQEERLFEQMTDDGHHAPLKKKKRTSGGASALNTPSITTSRQLGYPDPTSSSAPSSASKPTYIDASTSSRTPGLTVGRTASQNHRAHASNARIPFQSITFRKPIYADSATQTEESDDVLIPPSTYIPIRRQRYVSQPMQFLKQAREMRLRREESAKLAAQKQKPKRQAPQEPNDIVMADTPSAESKPTQMLPPPVPVSRRSEERQDQMILSSPTSEDVEMKDADVGDASVQPVVKPTAEAIGRELEIPVVDESPSSPTLGSHPPIQPPPPPWQSTTLKPISPNTAVLPPASKVDDDSMAVVKPLDVKPQLNGFRSADLRVPMPPPNPHLTNNAVTQSGSGTPPVPDTPSSMTGLVAQSPLALNPPFPLLSPAAKAGLGAPQAVMTPSPAKKKMSLKAYLARKDTSTETPSSAPTPSLEKTEEEKEALPSAPIPAEHSPPAVKSEPAPTPVPAGILPTPHHTLADYKRIYENLQANNAAQLQQPPRPAALMTASPPALQPPAPMMVPSNAPTDVKVADIPQTPAPTAPMLSTPIAAGAEVDKDAPEDGEIR